MSPDPFPCSTAVSAHISRGHLDTPPKNFSKGKISIATGTLRNAIDLQPLPCVQYHKVTEEQRRRLQKVQWIFDIQKHGMLTRMFKNISIFSKTPEVLQSSSGSVSLTLIYP